MTSSAFGIEHSIAKGELTPSQVYAFKEGRGRAQRNRTGELRADDARPLSIHSKKPLNLPSWSYRAGRLSAKLKKSEFDIAKGDGLGSPADNMVAAHNAGAHADMFKRDCAKCHDVARQARRVVKKSEFGVEHELIEKFGLTEMGAAASKLGGKAKDAGAAGWAKHGTAIKAGAAVAGTTAAALGAKAVAGHLGPVLGGSLRAGMAHLAPVADKASAATGGGISGTLKTVGQGIKDNKGLAAGAAGAGAVGGAIGGIRAGRKNNS